jgi:hypothetical protein
VRFSSGASRAGRRDVRCDNDHVAVPEHSELDEIAYALALRALDQQERVLDELRARTGVLLTATALVVSFLGARALTGDTTGWLSLPGVCAAVGSILIAVYLLAPKASLQFALDGAAVYEHFVTEDADPSEARRTLAYWLSDARSSNQAVIDRQVRMFSGACAALVTAVVLWAAALGLG